MVTTGVDLVVVSYKSYQDLGAFVDSLMHYPPDVPTTLTIVNVAPERADRETAQAARRLLLHESPIVDVHLVEFEENIGYNRAANHAGARGDREVVVCCNADVEFTDSPVLDEMHRHLLANATWGVIGPRQVNRAGRFTAAGIFGTRDKPKHRGWQQIDRGQYSDIRTDAVTVAGSIVGLRRDVWDELTANPVYVAHSDAEPGPFLPTTHGWGETGMCYLAASLGYDRVFLGHVYAVHHWQGAPGSRQFMVSNAGADRERFRSLCADLGVACD